MGARPVVSLGTANEGMGVSFVKFYFLKGLLPLDFSAFASSVNTEKAAGKIFLH